MSIAAVLRPAADRRSHRRHRVRLDACLDAAGRLYPCVITDVSAGGAQLLAELPPDLADARLEIEAFDSFACRVAWRSATRAGIDFTHDADEVTRRLAALLDGR